MLALGWLGAGLLNGDWRQNLEHAVETVGGVDQHYVTSYGQHWRAGYTRLTGLIAGHRTTHARRWTMKLEDLRDPDQRQARSGPDPQLVPGDQPGHCAARQAVARRGRAAEAAGARRGLGPGRVRRGAQAVGDVLQWRDQVHEALPARAAPVGSHPPHAADDGDAAQRQGAGLPAVPGVARRRPLRGPLPRRRPRGRRVGPDAADGQGAAAEVRRQAAVPGAHSPPCRTGSRRQRRASTRP